METPISKFIDHTLLKADATTSDIKKLCAEAIQFNFFGVCVNSRFMPLCKDLLKNSDVKVVSVIGFPLGAMSTEAKAFETKYCVENGADEIDMVIPVGALKEKDDSYVLKDIAAVVNSAAGKKVKVIIETCLLNEEEKKRACQLSLDAGAHFVKTSTGFSTGGATQADVNLMKSVVGDQAEVKASGGVKNLDHANEYIKLGATRLGTSSGVLIVQGQNANGGY